MKSESVTPRVREEDEAARKADLVRVHGRRLIDELRATVMRDVEACRDEFQGDQARDIVLEAMKPKGGFVVRKPASPAVSLTVAPDLAAAAMGCHYQFTPTNGLPPREDRLELVFAGVEGETLQMKHSGTGKVFATADANVCSTEHLFAWRVDKMVVGDTLRLARVNPATAGSLLLLGSAAAKVGR